MEKIIINLHWTNGGTGITNFDKKERWKYELAIKQVGDNSLLISEIGIPWANGHISNNQNSLHCVSDIKDLSKFWNVFESLNETKGTK